MWFTNLTILSSFTCAGTLGPGAVKFVFQNSASNSSSCSSLSLVSPRTLVIASSASAAEYCRTVLSCPASSMIFTYWGAWAASAGAFPPPAAADLLLPPPPLPFFLGAACSGGPPFAPVSNTKPVSWPCRRSSPDTGRNVSRVSTCGDSPSRTPPRCARPVPIVRLVPRGLAWYSVRARYCLNTPQRGTPRAECPVRKTSQRGPPR